VVACESIVTALRNTGIKAAATDRAALEDAWQQGTVP
jgi:hypothetical protein